jgi:hypothetical protein
MKREVLMDRKNKKKQQKFNSWLILACISLAIFSQLLMLMLVFGRNETKGKVHVRLEIKFDSFTTEGSCSLLICFVYVLHGFSSVARVAAVC